MPRLSIILESAYRGNSVKIAFFGLPLAALLLARDGHQIVSAAICRRDALGVRRLTRVLGKSVVALEPPITTRFVEKLASLQPNLVVSWYWTKKLPPSVLKLAPAFGVHPSLLPRHRGPDPTFWAIDQGDTETGVSAHMLEAEYDTGAVLLQETLAIDPAWNAWTLAKRLDRPSLRVLRTVCQGFAAGRAPSPIAQDETRATAAPMPSEAELELDPSWDAPRLLRRIRATSPYPGAILFLGDTPLVITHAALCDAREAHVLHVGEIAIAHGKVLLRVQDGALWLLAARVIDEPADGDANQEGEDGYETHLNTTELADFVQKSMSVLPFSALVPLR